MKVHIAFILLVVAVTGCGKQEAVSRDNAQVPSERTNHVVKTIAALFKDQYVYPDVGNDVETSLLDYVSRGRYAQIRSAKVLAEQLTHDIRAVTHDVHVKVSFGNPLDVPRTDRPAFSKLVRTAAFERIERMDGNIGYLKVAVFSVPEIFRHKADLAMHSLADTRALIIDVRGTPGGHAGSVAYLCSYFFDPSERVHLNSVVDRAGHEFKFWTEAVSQPYLNRPVYVLTSHTTGSGAEEFAYDMQAFGRAKIVGETTAGGAHTGGYQRVDKDFWVFVPTGRAVNPVTGSNWERVGVVPDIPSAPDMALQTAVSAVAITPKS